MEGGPQRLYSLLLLGLFACHFCGAQDPTNGEPFNASEQEEKTAATTNTKLVSEGSGPASQAKTMSQTRNSVNVQAGPPSLLTLEGHPASLECKFTAPENANVSWRKSCAPNCSQTFHFPSNNSNFNLEVTKGGSKLTFHRAKTRDSGMYYCVVTASDNNGQSCGTYLWVRRPRPTSFLNIRESIKNKIITAEGFLLLICAIGPGLFLLLRKRWENESLLQAKKKYEEENLYEGLNLDECSMYEDISRGLQATYQDIGNVKVIDLQLEKPEKP
uniref:B-cell antigen receptor complex-associated protein alpha chain n=1 Tax=Euleptes europaea TaxID=460621 RepID=UPI00254207CC|nr:B-cell antigen receptor complex-associated protein alpha chain [Euleptes europaea]